MELEGDREIDRDSLALADADVLELGVAEALGEALADSLVDWNVMVVSGNSTHGL